VVRAVHWEISDEKIRINLGVQTGLRSETVTLSSLKFNLKFYLDQFP